MISRISPARTPSRYLSNLTLNSGVKRRSNFFADGGESSPDENAGTPLKKTKSFSVEQKLVEQNFVEANLTGSPLSVCSVKSTKSTRSIKSTKSAKSTKSQDLLLVHSEEDEIFVCPNENDDPVGSDNTGDKKSMINRCTIM
jgi:hypothetical protein